MSVTKTFWVVWNPERGLPRYQHETTTDARAEAQRLARLHPGENFIVMQAIMLLRTHDPVEEILLDEIPF